MRTLSSALVLIAALGACAGRGAHGPSSSAPSPGEAPSEQTPGLRLPGHTRPLHYALRLEVDPQRERFAGEVTIAIETTAPRRVLWLHGRGLRVHEARVEGAEGVAIDAQYAEVDADGLASLTLPHALPAGRLRVTMKYDAPFGTKLRGLYRVRVGEDAYAFTQFEPLSAREAFPCFDEPRFKTAFDVRLSVPSGQVAIANAAEVRADPAAQEGMVEHVFASTEPLSTYLIAFAVGPLDVVAAPDIPAGETRDRPLPLRGVTVRGRGGSLAYALAHTPPMVEALERYFGIAYPYDKLDVLAVPDFAAGAMENAGAITFREYLLLLESDAEIAQKHLFANVMAHELAHQWFGNLVTMPFWDDIWLNEAFATWMATRIVAELYPDYRPELDELRYTHMAMDTDEKRSARAIRQPIETARDVDNAFDGITYSKGGAVLGMFESYLGDARFRQGLRLYMDRHAKGTATAEDLIRALSEASGEALEEPFMSFLTQPGLPLLQATLRCESGAARVSLRQSRFVPLGAAPDPEARWQLPVCVRHGRGEEGSRQCTFLRAESAELALEGEGCPDWWMPNADARGYYRWSVPAADLEALTGQGWPRLNEAERLSTAENLSASLRAGSGTPRAVYPALLRVAGQGDHHAVSTALGPLSFARDYLLEEPQQEVYRRRLREVIGPRVRELGLSAKSGEASATALLRRTLVADLCLDAAEPACREAYARAGASALGLPGGGGPKLGADLVGIALVVAVQDLGKPAFDAAVARLQETTDAAERGRLVRAIGLTRDPALANQVRALSLDPSVKQNEVLTLLLTLASERAERQRTWTWALSNLEALQQRLPGFGAAQVVELSGGFCSHEDAHKVQEAFDAHAETFAESPRALRQVIEGIELCAARADALRAEARAFFTEAD